MSKDNENADGRVAIVTGGARGIALGVAAERRGVGCAVGLRSLPVALAARGRCGRATGPLMWRCMASSEEPSLAAVGARGDHGGERLRVRQARVLEVLALAGAPLSGEAIGARLGVRAGSLSVTLRSLQRRGLIVAAARERARPGGWVLR
jgi:biotin operon repressor